MKSKRTKQIIRWLLLVGTLVSLFFVPWVIVYAWIRPLPETIEDQLKQTLGYGFDGVIVYVDEANKPPKHFTAGWHDRILEVPARPDALFKIASISKLYVALAITKLVTEEIISLDDKLSDHFPELIGKLDNADEIEIRMMVQHKSGIPNFTDLPDFWVKPPASSQEALALVFGLPADFEPGKGYGYSNTNYLLLKELMNRVLGYDHFEYIREKILNPLELHHTYGSLDEVDINDVMSGYYVGYEADLKAVENGMLATAEDVGKFLRALHNRSIFEKNELEIYSSIYVFGHTGLVPGYQSIARYHKDLDAVVVQFTNTTDFEGYNWNLSEISYNRIVKILRKQAS